MKKTQTMWILDKFWKQWTITEELSVRVKKKGVKDSSPV